MLTVFIKRMESTSVSVPFSLRVRLGHCEVEISGSKDEVMQVIKDLPSLVATISEAFTEAGVEASREPTGQKTSTLSESMPVSAVYPSIQSSGNCSEAVLRLLTTNWGRSTPRTLPELIEAMKANAVHYPSTTLSGVLNWLVRKGKVKRWKTEKGYVYVFAEPSVVHGSLNARVEADAASSSEGMMP